MAIDHWVTDDPKYKANISTYLFFFQHFVFFFATPNFDDKLVEETFAFTHFFNAFEAIVFAVLLAKITEAWPNGNS